MSEENETKKKRKGIDEDAIVGNVEKIIRVQHTFENKSDGGIQFSNNNDEDNELEATQKKLQIRENQLAAMALLDFQNKKNALLQKIPEDKRDRADLYIAEDPSRLQQLEFQYGGDSDDSGIEDVPPKGKVRSLLREPKGNTTKLGKYQNPELSNIAELYKIREQTPKSTDDMKMKSVAEVKVNELFSQIEDGLKARADGNKYNFQVAECSHCGTVLFGRDAELWAKRGVCSKCGYKPKAGGH